MHSSHSSYSNKAVVFRRNCGFPSLLIKRFRKGKTGNFALESFITTEAGKTTFREAIAFSKTDGDAAISLKALADMDLFVVDEEMQELDGASTGAVLVAVLEQILETVSD